jgi:methionyl-tRNA formyltransferase
MSEIKIILLCNSRFALPALRELAFFNMLAAVAIPAHYEEMIETVDQVVEGKDIPVIELKEESFAERLREAIEENEVNMGLVMTFGYKIPSSLYRLPSKGFFNVHPGLLPRYRGPDPVFQQLIHREKYAGVTIHRVDEKFDTGPVVMGEMLRIDSWDTHGTLTSKLADLAAKLTGTLVKMVSLDIAIPSKPQDVKKARYFKRQQAADITINWQTMDADSVISMVKACNPWNKGAVTKMNNRVIRLLDAEKLPANPTLQKEPGFILGLEENGMIVSTINGGKILVKIVYVEEGFLPANHLAHLGVVAGNRFEMV